MAGQKPSTRYATASVGSIGTSAPAASGNAAITKTCKVPIEDDAGVVRVANVGDIVKDVVKAGAGDPGTVTLDSVELFTNGNLQAAGGAIATNGSITANSGYSYINYTSVAGWDGIRTVGAHAIAFYTAESDEAVIGSRIGVTGTTDTPIPPNATHVRISSMVATLAEYLATGLRSAKFYRTKHDLNWMALSAANLSGAVDTHDASANLVDSTEFYSTPGYVAYNHATTPGTFVANSNYKTSKLINVSGISSVKLRMLLTYSLCWYDATAAAANPTTGFEDFTTGCIGGAGAPAATILYDQIVTVPTNAVYCRLNVMANSGIQTYVKPWGAHFDLASLKAAVSGKKVMPGLYMPRSQVEVPNNQWYGKKLIWMGTSVTSGTYCGDKPYSALVGDILGATIYNYSMNGNRLHMVSDGEGGLEVERTSPVSGAFAGTEAENLAAYPEWDDGGTAGVLNEAYRPRSYERALLGQTGDLYIFDKESNNNSGAGTTDWDDFDVDTWSYGSGTFASHRGTYLGALLYLLNALWTENPLARVVFIGWQGNASATIRTQTQTLCTALNLPYIDMWKKMQYNVTINKSLLTANGDGGHPNATWSAMIAPGLANELLLV